LITVHDGTYFAGSHSALCTVSKQTESSSLLWRTVIDSQATGTSAYLRRLRHRRPDDATVLGSGKSSLAALGGSAALAPACAPRRESQPSMAIVLGRFCIPRSDITQVLCSQMLCR